ncbi:MAG: hypothetical protein HDR71_12360 [Lachnospiraceae bacterium]|nr:hypothetical protein [Lachnospiraceae bacterium]
MIKLKYIGCKTEYNVDFSRISNHVIQVIGELPFKDKGFHLSRIGKEDAWDYSGYTTLYREVEGGLQFSDDGSVYVEPVKPDPIPDPEPYVPTEEEMVAIFEQSKKDKILFSKSLLAEYLEEHPLTSSAHGGVEGVYSVTSEKQSLMMSQYMTYQIAKTVDPSAKLTWNETGKSCEEWAEQDFVQLILEIKEYVYPLVSYQQTLEEQINVCTTQEMLDTIVVDFASVRA